MVRHVLELEAAIQIPAFLERVAGLGDLGHAAGHGAGDVGQGSGGDAFHLFVVGCHALLGGWLMWGGLVVGSFVAVGG